MSALAHHDVEGSASDLGGDLTGKTLDHFDDSVGVAMMKCLYRSRHVERTVFGGLADTDPRSGLLGRQTAERLVVQSQHSAGLLDERVALRRQFDRPALRPHDERLADERLEFLNL